MSQPVDPSDRSGPTGSTEPAYPEPTYTEPTYTEPTYTEPTYTEPTYTEPAYPEPAYNGPAYPDPLPIIDASVPPVRPKRQRHRRGMFWVAVLASVALLVTGTVTAVVSYVDDGRPGGVVKRYFAALARGDAAAALGFGALPAGSQVLLTEPVLRAQLKIGPMSNFAVLAETAGGSGTDVDVQYALTVSGRTSTITDTVAMVRSGHSWRLRSSAVAVPVAFSGAANRATVLGAAVPTGEQLMFPGAVPFVFDTPNLQLAAASSVIRFSKTPTPLTVQLSPAGTAAAGRALDSAVKACLDGTAPVLALCPPPPDNRAVPGSLRGTAGKAASSTARLALADSVDGVVTITGPVPVNGTYDQLDFNDLPAVHSFNGEISLAGHLLVTAPDKVIWDVA